MLLGALSIICALACGDEGTTTIVNSGDGISGINVSGTGTALGTPDIVLLQLGASTQASTVAAARETAARAMQAVIDSLKSNGVADKDIQTTQFSISPMYDFSGSSRTLRGYQVSNIVSVKLRKVDTASKALDDAAAAGGNSVVINSISFSIDDPTDLQKQAREQAVAKAKARAEELAAHSNVKLGKVITLTEVDQQVVTQTGATASAPRAVDTSSPVQAGELQVTVTVNVVYAIE